MRSSERKYLNAKYQGYMGDNLNTSSLAERIFFVQNAERQGMVGPLSPEQKQYLQKQYNLHLEIKYKTRQIGQHNYLLIHADAWGSSPGYISCMQEWTARIVQERDALVNAFEAARFAEPSEPAEAAEATEPAEATEATEAAEAADSSVSATHVVILVGLVCLVGLIICLV